MDKKINVAIVGLGQIFDHHITGLLNNADKYNIVALCDIILERKILAEKLSCDFYSDYKKMAKEKNIDVVLILTPPKTHYEIAKEMLNNKKHVIIEKPGVVQIEHLYQLIDLAKEKNVLLDVIFHWCYGSEIEFLKENLHKFGKLIKIEGEVFDTYTTENLEIKTEKVGLNGSWNDSGINILSMISLFLDIKKFKLIKEEFEYDLKQNLPIYAKKEYMCDDIKIVASVNWKENRNHKFTNFYFDKGTLFVNHTAQDIWFNAERVATFYSPNRLDSHYTNLFSSYKFKPNNLEHIIELHKILLNS